jgi:ribosome-binding factor A
MSRRLEQVASTLKRAIQEVLARGLSDPRIGGMVTVTNVVVSEDLASATVRVSVMPHDRENLTLHGLQDAAAHIRRKVGDLVSLRRVPQLLFKADQAARREAEVVEALSRVAAERERRSAAGGSPAAPAQEGSP